MMYRIKRRIEMHEFRFFLYVNIRFWTLFVKMNCYCAVVYY